MKMILIGLFCLSAIANAHAVPILKNTENQAQPLLIFVSLSMPKTTLKALYEEAQTHRAVLVLRGLKDNSFKKTTENLQQLGIALQIDPLLFKKYQIKTVPTFVWVTETETHTLVGNVSLGYALSQFKEAS